MKTLGILGGNGMLGSDLSVLASSIGYKVIKFDLPKFDITSEKDLNDAVSQSDLIVNCAAYTAVDKAESEKEKAFQINADAVEKLGLLSKKMNRYVVHISTDFVFGDLSNSPLTEESKTFPLGVYGASKLKGEESLLKSGAEVAVIRVEWTYGRNGINFIEKIIDNAKKNSTIKVVSDQFGAPTPTTEAARAILCFLSKKTLGIYHFSALGYASRFDVAKFIVEKLNIKTEVVPCQSSDFVAPAQRPLNSKFDCSKIDKILDFKRKKWNDYLLSYLKNRKKTDYFE